MEKSPFTLNDKCILVTGASSGIGRSTAIECSKLGARLIIIGRNEKRLNETFSQLSGTDHSTYVLDLNDKQKVADFIDQLPKLDGIVYSAGTQKTSPVKMIQQEDLLEIFETNFFSVVYLSKLLLEKKKINKFASLVFVSSITANLLSETGNSIYSASKGAINAFYKVLATELAPRKIRVNAVMPGMVKTDLLKKCSIDESEFAENEKLYPLGYGEPEDVAYAIIYLLSNASRWVTGTNLVLDGGLTLR